MIYEVPTLTARERRQLRTVLERSGKWKTCSFEMITGRTCMQGRILVRVRKDPMDRGKLMALPYCRVHASDEWLERLGLTRFGGKTSTSGRNRSKRSTKPLLVMRELVEEHIIDFLKPYMEALTAEKEVVVGHGRSARVEKVPDHRARMQAAESLFDRVYGKAKQSTEISGGISVEPVEVPTDNERELAVAEILAAAGAIKAGKNPQVIAGAAAVADAKARKN